MRIAFISHEYPPDTAKGGIGTYVAQAARALSGAGHQVEVFASTPNPSRVDRDGSLTEHWISETNYSDFAVVAGHLFANRHREEPFDVLEGPEYLADARKAVELVPDIPLVVKMHTPSLLIGQLNTDQTKWGVVKETLNQLKTVLTNRFQSRLSPNDTPFMERMKQMDWKEHQHCSLADIVASPSTDLCEYAKQQWGIPAQRVRLVPYPYQPSQQLLDIPIETKTRTVGFVGRLEARKGIETLAAAIPKVLAKMPDVRFRFIGRALEEPRSGVPYDQWIQRRLRQHSQQLEFVGPIALDQVPTELARMDVAVFPSRWENFPNVCLEAMAAGRGIVGSTAGGMAEQLDGGKAGLLVPPDRPDRLASAVLELTKDDDKRQDLGSKARQRVCTEYAPARIADLMVQVYREAIELKRAQLNDAKPATTQSAGCV